MSMRSFQAINLILVSANAFYAEHYCLILKKFRPRRRWYARTRMIIRCQGARARQPSLWLQPLQESANAECWASYMVLQYSFLERVIRPNARSPAMHCRHARQ